MRLFPLLLLLSACGTGGVLVPQGKDTSETDGEADTDTDTDTDTDADGDTDADTDADTDVELPTAWSGNVHMQQAGMGPSCDGDMALSLVDGVLSGTGECRTTMGPPMNVEVSLEGRVSDDGQATGTASIESRDLPFPFDPADFTGAVAMDHMELAWISTADANGGPPLEVEATVVATPDP